MAVREAQAMLSGMNPVLVDGKFIFCTVNDVSLLTAVQSRALCWFKETEGVSLILDDRTAVEFGFDTSLPMSRIILEVYSALDGVGLTAAVSSALSVQGIPCNMVAAFHHDNVFVPSSMAEQALAILRAVQQQSAEHAPPLP